MLRQACSRDTCDMAEGWLQLTHIPPPYQMFLRTALKSQMISASLSPSLLSFLVPLPVSSLLHSELHLSCHLSLPSLSDSLPMSFLGVSPECTSWSQLCWEHRLTQICSTKLRELTEKKDSQNPENRGKTLHDDGKVKFQKEVLQEAWKVTHAEWCQPGRGSAGTASPSPGRGHGKGH